MRIIYRMHFSRVCFSRVHFRNDESAKLFYIQGLSGVNSVLYSTEQCWKAPISTEISSVPYDCNHSLFL